MNFIRSTFSPVQQLFAGVAIFALVLSLVYGAIPFVSAQGNPNGNVGSMNTVSGSCGSPVNVNQYAIGEAVLLKGKGFDSNVTLLWDISPAAGGGNAVAIAQGSVTTDNNGDFCFIAIQAITSSTALAEYKATTGKAKSDNFKIVAGQAATGNVTIVKQVNDVSGNNVSFSFTSTFPVNGNFSLNGGQNKSFLAQDAGSYTISEGSQPQGWSYSSVSCNSGTWSANGPTLSVTLVGGENMICTFTNTLPDVCPNIENAQATVPVGKLIDNAGNCVDIPPPPVDVCPNLDGNQSIVPDGYALVGGQCVVVPPPVDVCPNIDGAQATIPVGKMIDNSGNCVDIPPPPVDVCPNLEGLQTQVPVGYVLDDGECVPEVPPTDYCPNIDGVQTSVPEGKLIDNAGNCVDIPPPPVDVCSNLEGNQSVVPDGYTLVGGQCVIVPPPVDVCPNIDGAQATIPVGKMIDNSGNCVDIPPPPVDICPNIQGDQAIVPNGLVLNDAGNCVEDNDDPEEPKGSITLEKVVTGEDGDPTINFGFGSEFAPITISANSPGYTLPSLAAKSYSFQENNLSGTGWVLTGVSCVDNSTQVVTSLTPNENDSVGIALASGQDLTCTFTNTRDFGCTNPLALNFEEDATKDNGTCTFAEPTYTLEGFVWNDANSNDQWEQFDENSEDGIYTEEDLAGWTVSATNGNVTLTTETDADGYYSFTVVGGTWTISETVQNEWSQTFPNDGTHVVTVPGSITANEQSTLFASIMNTLVPLAHAQVAPTYYNFGNVFAGCTSNCGGGGGGGGGNGVRISLVDNDDDTEDEEEPVGEVLGESTSVLPVGAPNTGAGGAAATPFASLISLFGMLVAVYALRATKNVQ